MLDKSICHFRGVQSILLLLFCLCWKILIRNSVDPDQMPHYVASDFAHDPFNRSPGKNGLKMPTRFLQKQAFPTELPVSTLMAMERQQP